MTLDQIHQRLNELQAIQDPTPAETEEYQDLYIEALAIELGEEGAADA